MPEKNQGYSVHKVKTEVSNKIPSQRNEKKMKMNASIYYFDVAGYHESLWDPYDLYLSCIINVVYIFYICRHASGNSCSAQIKA